MTDETAKHPQAKRSADETLTLFALKNDVERGAMLGAMIACGAAGADKTPIEFLDYLRGEMPRDDEWISSRMGDRTRLKMRNQTRWYRAYTVTFLGKGNQG